MYWLLANPWVILGIVIFSITTHTIAYYKGYQSRDTKAKVELLKETEAKLEAVKAYDKVSREYVKSFQTKQQETKIVYRTIKEKAKNETTGRVCFNDNTARMWDSALQGVLPETSSGTDEETSRTYTDTEIIENAAVNFELHKECRDQLNALITWHENN